MNTQPHNNGLCECSKPELTHFQNNNNNQQCLETILKENTDVRLIGNDLLTEKIQIVRKQ